MDLVSEMLIEGIQRSNMPVQPLSICPRFVSAFTRVPLLRTNPAALLGDRLVNRFWIYPRSLRSQLHNFDLFHIVDHSYAHLVHELPAQRTVVTCHDLDA